MKLHDEEIKLTIAQHGKVFSVLSIPAKESLVLVQVSRVAVSKVAKLL